jgi:AraC-like DNA-binding protein
MDYRTYATPEALIGFVRCFWTLDSPVAAMPVMQRIVPDGCMEMIFHYGDLYRQYAADGRFILQPRAFVFGQVTSALDIAPTGATGIFAVRFQPEGFLPLAMIPLRAMENRAVPLEELFGAAGRQLEKEVLETSHTPERIKAVEGFLRDRLAAPEAIDRVVRSGISLLLEQNGHLSVDALSRQLNINRRQLERRFAAVIGLSPKQLARIIRLQAALKILLSGQYTSLTSLAYEGDYYDQSHFIKDFKEFTGISPGKFYADNLKMSAFFHGSD